MNIENKKQKDANSGDSHQSYIYGVQNYSMPLCPNNQLFLFPPSVISSRLFINNIPQNLSMQDSGNIHLSSNFGGENMEQSFIRQPFQSQNQGVSVQSSGYLMGREVNNHSTNYEIPSLNNIASKVKQGNYVHYQQNQSYLKPQRMNLPQDYREEENCYTEERRAEFTNQYSNGQRSPPKEDLVVTHSFDDNGVNLKQSSEKLLIRNRHHSDSSTESVESPPSKFQKVSEDACIRRGKINHEYESSNYRSKHTSSTKNSKGKGKIINPNEQYEMKRLNMGDNFDKSKAQHELKSRLKAMVYSYKVLREDKAIVVPSLPSILSHLDA